MFFFKLLFSYAFHSQFPFMFFCLILFSISQLLSASYLRHSSKDYQEDGLLVTGNSLNNFTTVRKLDLSHLCFSLNFYFLMSLLQFPSMFPLLTYSPSFFFLICCLPKTLKMKEKQDSIQLIQEQSKYHFTT